MLWPVTETYRYWYMGYVVLLQRTRRLLKMYSSAFSTARDKQNRERSIRRWLSTNRHITYVGEEHRLSSSRTRLVRGHCLLVPKGGRHMHARGQTHYYITQSQPTWLVHKVSDVSPVEKCGFSTTKKKHGCMTRRFGLFRLHQAVQSHSVVL